MTGTSNYFNKPFFKSVLGISRFCSQKSHAKNLSNFRAMGLPLEKNSRCINKENEKGIAVPSLSLVFILKIKSEVRGEVY